MKNIPLFFLLVLFGWGAGALHAQVPCYKDLRAEGLKLMDEKKYGDASSKFWAAFTACPDKPDDNDLSKLLQQCQTRWVSELEVSVQQQKEAYQSAVAARREAETAKVSEEKARQEAEKNAKKAREQGIRAESLRMALVSDMVRQKGRASDAMALSYLALQMAGANASPPMMRAFADAVRDSFVVPFYNSPDAVVRMELLDGGSTPGVLLKRTNGGHLLVRPAGNGRQAQVTEWNADRTNMVASPQGDRFVGWGASPTAQIFDASGAVQAVLDGHLEPIRTAAFSPDGRLIVTGSRDNTARLWDITGKVLAVLQGHSGNVLWTKFSPDGSFVLTRSSDGTARTWSAKDGTPLGVIQADNAYLRDVYLAPGSKQIVALFSDGQARLYTPDGRPGAVLVQAGQAAKDACFAHSSPLLAVRLGNTSVRLCSPAGEALATCEHPARVAGMALRADGSGLATWADDQVVRLWDAGGRLLRELRGHRAALTSATFSPDGQFFLTMSRDGTAKLWDPEGNIWTDWAAGPNPLAQFMPDGKAFLTTVNGGKSIAQMPLPALVYGQIDRTKVLASAATKAVLDEFKVQFLDALQEQQ